MLSDSPWRTSPKCCQRNGWKSLCGRMVMEKNPISSFLSIVLRCFPRGFCPKGGRRGDDTSVLLRVVSQVYPKHVLLKLVLASSLHAGLLPVLQFSSVPRCILRSDKLICAPPRLSDVSPTVPLKQFQCSSD